MSETSGHSLVLAVVSGHVALVTLHRPERRNAIDLPFAGEIDATLTALEQDPEVRAIVLTGAGPAFCAGADLKALAAGEAEAFVGDRGWAGITHRNGPIPLIAAVEGPALAGGCELVLACDLAVCSRTASFGLPEARHGLLAAAGGAVRLPAAVGSKAAHELLLIGRTIDAAKALSLGLVNRVVDDGHAVASALEMAAAISENGQAAVSAARRVIADVLANGEESAHRLAADLLKELLASEHTHDRLNAFGQRGRRSGSAHGTDRN